MEVLAKEELDAPVLAESPVASIAINDIFQAHGAYVARALSCLGVPEAEREDAVQEVFLVVHRRLEGFEGRASIRTWLYAICVRRALARRRTRARRREDATPGTVERISHELGPHEQVEKQRALAAAMKILEGIDDDKRAVFVLYDVEQLPMSDVAEALELPLQTAYSRLYAARRDVARILARLRAQGRAP
jgi:RNA polymerase sigma-70 factor (ECF subfamily)